MNYKKWLGVCICSICITINLSAESKLTGKRLSKPKKPYGIKYSLHDDDWDVTCSDRDYDYRQTKRRWAVVGVRPNPLNDFDLTLYENSNCTDSLSGSYLSGAKVDFVARDYHHLPIPNYDGVRINKYSGPGCAYVEYENNNETLEIGQQDFDWPVSDVVEIYDFNVNKPGWYTISLYITNSNLLNLGIGLFDSYGDADRALARNEMKASSDTSGVGGGERFNVLLDHPDVYGITAWSDTRSGSGNYTISILREPFPVISYETLKIDDDSMGASSGNNDSIVEAGERIELAVKLCNTGEVLSTPISGYLSTSDTFISIIDSTTQWYHLSPGNCAWSIGNFLFDVSPNTPIHNATFYLRTVYNNVWKIDTFSIPVYNAKLVYNAHIIDDDNTGNSHGNDNNIPEAGETIEMLIELKNIGSIDVNNITISLRTDDNMIEILNGISTVSQITAWDSSWCDNPFIFRVHPGSHTHNAKFSLYIASEQGEWTDSFYVRLEHPCEFVEICTDSLFFSYDPDPYTHEESKSFYDGEGGELAVVPPVYVNWHMVEMRGSVYTPTGGILIYSFGKIVAADPETYDTLYTLRLPDIPPYGNVHYSGLAFDYRGSGSFWYTVFPYDSLYHISALGNLLGVYPSYYDSITGLAFDADNCHLWAIKSGDPDKLLLYDVSDNTPNVILGPVEIHWNNIFPGGSGAAGLDYDEGNNTLIAVNSGVSSVFFFRGMDQAVSAWYPLCSVENSLIPNPWGLAFNRHTQKFYITDLNTYGSTAVLAYNYGNLDFESLSSWNASDERTEKASDEEIVIRGFSLNIARSQAILQYELKKHENVRIRIYDISGRSVKELKNCDESPGLHSTTWDLRTDFGKRAASGVYFIVLETDEFTTSKKFLLIGR